jgi:hypothetical protein
MQFYSIERRISAVAEQLLSCCIVLQYELRKSWKDTLPESEHKWVRKALFCEGTFGLQLREHLQLWWYPSEPNFCFTQPPSSPDVFFNRPFFLWMPYRIWSIRFTCIQERCTGHRLAACGLYKQVRQVLDISVFYYMAT